MSAINEKPDRLRVTDSSSEVVLQKTGAGAVSVIFDGTTLSTALYSVYQDLPF